MWTKIGEKPPPMWSILCATSAGQTVNRNDKGILCKTRKQRSRHHICVSKFCEERNRVLGVEEIDIQWCDTDDTRAAVFCRCGEFHVRQKKSCDVRVNIGPDSTGFPGSMFSPIA